MHSLGRSFPVRNDFSRAEQESQKDKKRHWTSHFKRFKLQHKAKRNLKSDPSYHLLKKALIACEKVPMIAWETSLFNGCTYKHSSYTHREICNYVLEGKNSSKGLNFNKKWRKTTNGTHRSIFWRRRWKSIVCHLQTHLYLMAACNITKLTTHSLTISRSTPPDCSINHW